MSGKIKIPFTITHENILVGETWTNIMLNAFSAFLPHLASKENTDVWLCEHSVQLTELREGEHVVFAEAFFTPGVRDFANNPQDFLDHGWVTFTLEFVGEAETLHRYFPLEPIFM